MVITSQLLAVLENSADQAHVAAAAARLRQAEAELRRLLNGAGQEERREAWAAVEHAEAVLRHTELEMARRQMLFRRDYIAREEADQAERDSAEPGPAFKRPEHATPSLP
jgi:HlyD family secretion protein